MAAWTNDLVAEARRLWGEGYSARLIADRLGEGFTKNAVIGKANRQKWGQRRTAYQRPNPLNERIKAGKIAKAKARTHAAPKPPPPPPAPPPPPKPRLPPGTYTLLDLRPHECKWPVNSPPKGSAAFLFCGERTFGGHPYCEHHVQLGFSGKGTARRPEAAGWVHKPMVTG